jgi:predicted Fe-S protein YdhL (DUF1289 family)
MDRSGYCTGCARTLAEIGAWSCLSNAERLGLMEQLPARKASMQANPCSSVS